MHQGLNHLKWNIEDLLGEYPHLREHVGFPAGRNDPVFLQDKIKYLRSLVANDYLPTLRIDIDMPHISEYGETMILAKVLESIEQ